jgi:SAM-dependent methyltransferase
MLRGPGLLFANLRRFAAIRKAERAEAFDLREGTDTSGLIAPIALDVPRAARAHGSAYLPTLPGTFARVLAELPDDCRRSTFVDLGSGKGRVLLLASRASFARVMGIEWSAELCRIARENIEASRASGRLEGEVEVLCQNAAEFDPPAGDLVVYFFRPFDEHLLGPLLERLSKSLASSGRRVFFLDVHPSAEALMARHPVFKVYSEFHESRPGSSEFSWRIYVADTRAVNVSEQAPESARQRDQGQAS